MPRFISDLPIFFTSFDEPNALETFDALRGQAPRPITHVQGIAGLDAVILHCARSTTEAQFVTIAADNRVNPALFFQKLPACDPDVVQVFRAKNLLTGLEYERGAVKVWPRGTVLAHRTRESAEIETAFVETHYRKVGIDFLASQTDSGLTPIHAYRSAYREVLRLSLVENVRLRDFNETWGRLSAVARSRILVWTSVGADHENGWWSIFGARQAIHDFFVMNYSHDQINDYEKFAEGVENILDIVDPEYAAKSLRRRINKTLPLQIADLEADQSAHIKRLYVNPAYGGDLTPYLPSLS